MAKKSDAPAAPAANAPAPAEEKGFLSSIGDFVAEGVQEIERFVFGDEESAREQGSVPAGPGNAPAVPGTPASSGGTGKGSGEPAAPGNALPGAGASG